MSSLRRSASAKSPISVPGRPWMTMTSSMGRSFVQSQATDEFGSDGAGASFQVMGTNFSPRRHTHNFDHNPLQVQGRRRLSQYSTPQATLEAPIHFPSQPPVQIAIPTTPAPTPPGPALVRRSMSSVSSRYTPSPLSRTASFPTVAEEDDSFLDAATKANQGATKRPARPNAADTAQQRPLSLHQASLLRRASSRSLGGGGRNPPTAFSFVPPTRKSHSAVSLTSGSSSSTRLSQSYTPEYADTFTAEPSTSRDPGENWLTATAVPVFSRASLPSVIMPLAATPKNRARLSSTSSRASSLDDHLSPPRRPGSTSRSSSQTSLSSATSWDSLGSIPEGDGGHDHSPHSISVSPLSSEGDHNQHLQHLGAQDDARKKIGARIKRAWKSIIGKPRS